MSVITPQERNLVVGLADWLTFGVLLAEDESLEQFEISLDATLDSTWYEIVEVLEDLTILEKFHETHKFRSTCSLSTFRKTILGNRLSTALFNHVFETFMLAGGFYGYLTNSETEPFLVEPRLSKLFDKLVSSEYCSKKSNLYYWTSKTRPILQDHNFWPSDEHFECAARCYTKLPSEVRQKIKFFLTGPRRNLHWQLGIELPEEKINVMPWELIVRETNVDEYVAKTVYEELIREFRGENWTPKTWKYYGR